MLIQYAKTKSSVCDTTQAGAPIPESAWEYHMRAALNDAAYKNLRYVPYCSTLPVTKKCEDARFMWVSELCASCPFVH
jgi:hypothetical protein